MKRNKILASVMGALSGAALAVALTGDASVKAGEVKKDCQHRAALRSTAHEVAELFVENVHTAVWDQIRKSR